jgi:hypothetical protein
MSKLKKMQGYLPEFYLEILEMQEILKAESQELQILHDEVNEVLNASFITRTSEKTIKLWERQFNLNLEGFNSLEDKQQEILTKMLGFAKLSCSKIQSIVLTKTGYKSTAGVENSDIVITYDDIGYPNDDGQAYIKSYIEQLKPAHLGFRVVFIFRKHETLRPYTHEHLSQYSHYQIRTNKEEL